MKPIRYSKRTKTLHIGGRENKLAIFFRERSARLHILKRDFHFGKAWG